MDDLTQDDLPTLRLHQVVNVVRGRHRGKRGKAHFIRAEGNSARITLIADDSEYLYVNSYEIDFEYVWVEAALYMDDESRAGFFARIKEIEDSYD